MNLNLHRLFGGKQINPPASEPDIGTRVGEHVKRCLEQLPAIRARRQQALTELLNCEDSVKAHECAGRRAEAKEVCRQAKRLKKVYLQSEAAEREFLRKLGQVQSFLDALTSTKSLNQESRHVI